MLDLLGSLSSPSDLLNIPSQIMVFINIIINLFLSHFLLSVLLVF